jgi:hypothetical protein
VPDLVHELGVADPLCTLGPMQVQRWRSQDHFEQALGRQLDAHAVKGLGRISVEGYVAGSVAFYEDYLRRLAVGTGRDVPSATARGD